ncbi:uncharacterized protein HMPREF1541_10891 [Cyphellophora europaea CBS 101466]|uniref:Uncharacterized protein n=1 Tax=Cyphellophora europaea (strain CBS 101466) TaxID=1220924 RepID=W2S5P0_CYPE1|nr:uncharacterized protein HMPREF1541_10891 [Cyphellophora europaea CBS 101466]ETN44026.1 hypothetical protein HMPREF1541_10891 [Cyphellophora europaea CBS 101466]
MEIEDIINKVRFTSSENETDRPRSLRESTDTSIISESRSAPESISPCLENFSSDDYGTYDVVVSHSGPCRRQKQAQVNEEVQHWEHGPPKKRRAMTKSETYDSQELPKPRPPQQPQQQMPVSYGHAMQPMYYPAYMVVPMPVHMPPATHMAPHPGSFSVSQRRHYPPEPQQRTYKEAKHSPKPHPRGVRLPPLPERLRRTQTTSNRKPLQLKEKKTRVRAPPVVHAYDHLSVEEAIQELAQRNIHITDMAQIDISKANLVRLLQRADRNNNRGNGNPSERELTSTPA